MMFTLDGVPLLYNGMEVGDTTESGDPALFEKLTVFWQPKQREKFRETYRQLIELRQAHPAFRTGEVTWLENSAPQNLVSFLRRDGHDEFVVAVNFSNRPQAGAVTVPPAAISSRCCRSRPPARSPPAWPSWRWARSSGACTSGTGEWGFRQLRLSFSNQVPTVGVWRSGEA